ncbi:MAG: primosomal protein [Flammeovirgaceae bacterium]|nr:primosomal protein [Flammeovirgaceae bacterium]
MNKNLKLLTEWSPLNYTPDLIKESKENNGGKIFLKGILQRCNTLNQNGRIYSRSILQREITNYQKFIKENRALGECDHPDSSVVELKNVSHIVRDARMDGDNVVGTIEILETPNGNILAKLIEAGVTLGISSRGVGSTRKEGNTQVVQDDFQLICFDMVSEPSTPGAFMIREGKDVSQEELDKHFTSSDRIDRIFNDILSW